MTIHILHFTESYGAGVGTAIEQYMQFAGADHSLLARSRPETVTCVGSPTASRVLVTSRRELALEWIRHRERPFDVVHVHSSAAGVIARTLPHPTAGVVYSPHAMALSHENWSIRLLAKKVERRLASRTHAFAAVSESERQQLALLVRNCPPASVIPHAMTTDQPPRARGERAPRVVAVGRLTFQKNPESVAELPGRLRAAVDMDVEFVWIGHGDPARRSLLESHGWRVTGWLTPPEVRDLVSTSIVTVHPARYEALPISVLESLAVGTPVVATDLPPLRDFSSILRYHSQTEMEAFLASLLSDTDRWTSLADEGMRQVSSEFNRSTQDAALEELYGYVMARHTSDG